MNKYKLTKRTYEKLRELNDKIELAKVLNAALAISPFIELFSSKPNIITIWQFSSMDWEQFGKTVSGIKGWQYSVLRKFCYDEEGYHSIHNNRDDILFWRKMQESFNEKI